MYGTYIATLIGLAQINGKSFPNTCKEEESLVELISLEAYLLINVFRIWE
jgi:hypothetical protein